jgi:hypothetical protein
MSHKLIRAALMSLFVLLGLGSNAWAETYHGFVKDPFYIGKGGKVVSPQDFATNPTKYTRSDVVYLTLREHFSQVVGKPLSDADFRTLLKSDEVRLGNCTGKIKTAGVTSQGKIAWHERACYKNERLIEVKVPGGWMVAASQGCYNPVEGIRPELPKKAAAPALIDGQCGPASGVYSASATALRGLLCTVGTATTFVTLPRPGHTATYSCFEQNGGKRATCPISVLAEAPPPPAPLIPQAIPTVTVVPMVQAGLSPLVVPTCDQTIVVGGVPAVVGTRVIQTRSFTP